MLGTYPILLDDRAIGELHVTRDGLMTVFSAVCEDPGGLLRLSVYGEKEGYLGVMMPDGAGALTLQKRLSRCALADFPQQIKFAAPAGNAAAGSRPDREASTETSCVPRQETHEETERSSGVQWRRGAGGALIGGNADGRYLAIPLRSEVLPLGEGFRRQTINGSEYAVFSIRDGKII